MSNARVTDQARYSVHTIHKLKYGLYEGTKLLVNAGEHIKILEDHGDYYVVGPVVFDLIATKPISIPEALLEFAIEGRSE